MEFEDAEVRLGVEGKLPFDMVMASRGDPGAEGWVGRPNVGEELLPEDEGRFGGFVDMGPVEFRCVEVAEEELVVLVHLAKCTGVKTCATIVDEFGKSCNLEVLADGVYDSLVALGEVGGQNMIHAVAVVLSEWWD